MFILLRVMQPKSNPTIWEICYNFHPRLLLHEYNLMAMEEDVQKGSIVYDVKQKLESQNPYPS